MNPGRVWVVGGGQIGTAVAKLLVAAGRDVGVSDFRRATALRSSELSGALLVEDPPLVEDMTIVVALPVPEIVRWVERMGPQLRPGTLLIDTGSTKRQVVAAMDSYVAVDVNAVGGHPLAGTATPGPDGADPAAFVGAPFILCPVRNDAGAVDRAADVARSIGTEPVVMDAGDHDSLMAGTSHLAHVLAYALAAAAHDDLHQDARLLSSGFRGVVRLALSGPEMVAGFLHSNADEVTAAIGRARSFLDHIEEALGDANETRLVDVLQASHDALSDLGLRISTSTGRDPSSAGVTRRRALR